AIVFFFVLFLSIIKEASGLPLAFYSEFLLERRYGLSNETLRAWLRDRAKAFAVGLVLGGAGAELIYWLMRSWPDTWWLTGAALFTVLARPPPPVALSGEAARPGCAARAAPRAGRSRRRARPRRVRVGPRRQNEKSQRGARRSRIDAAHSRVRHDARRVLGRRDRGRARARNRAPRPRRHLEGHPVRQRARPRRLLS